MILKVTTRSRTELVDITSEVARAVRQSGLQEGLCLISVPHTTAGVTINEGADPSVAEDILAALERIVPRRADYRHAEGNSPAHVKAALVGASQTVAIEAGALVLGTWQAIFLCEFDGPRTRSVHLRLLNTPFAG